MRWVLLLLCGVAAADELPPLGPERPLPPMEVSESTTPEGLTLWVARRAGLPKASALLVLRGGAGADPKGLEGMSELLAYTLAEGTRTRSARQIAEELQAVGAELSADWNPDALFLDASGLSDGTGRMIEVLADLARNASFPDAEVALVKANTIALLAERESTPEFIGERAFARALFGAHPYHLTHATRAVIGAVTPEILRREYARRFRPDRALLLVVGDVEVDQVRQIAARAFHGWQAGGPAPPLLPAPPPLPTSPLRRIVVVDRPGSVQSHIIVGRVAPAESDARFFAALVGSTVLGGMASSRLTANLREDKGYSYTPSSELNTFERAGMFELVADVRTEVTAPALVEAFYELDRMWMAPVKPDELARAQRYQTGSWLVRNQAQPALATTLAKSWVLGLGSRPERVARTQAVTLDSLQRVGEGLFPSQSQTVVVVGDAARIRESLQRLGEVSVVAP
jgi:zinc protease